jgi:hypothetical protein
MKWTIKPVFELVPGCSANLPATAGLTIAEGKTLLASLQFTA